MYNQAQKIKNYIIKNNKSMETESKYNSPTKKSNGGKKRRNKNKKYIKFVKK